MSLLKQLFCQHKGTYFIKYDKIKHERVFKCAYCGTIIRRKLYK